MLNKITGCESRTVPPLYVLKGEDQRRKPVTGETWEGRSSLRKVRYGMSQKTYALVSDHPCAFMGVCFIAGKRLRC